MRRIAVVAALFRSPPQLMFAGTAQAHQCGLHRDHQSTRPKCAAGRFHHPARPEWRSKRGWVLPELTTVTGVHVFIIDYGSGTLFGPFPSGRRSSTRRLRARPRVKRISAAPTARPEQSSTTSPAPGMPLSSLWESPTARCPAWFRHPQSRRTRAPRATDGPVARTLMRGPVGRQARRRSNEVSRECCCASPGVVFSELDSGRAPVQCDGPHLVVEVRAVQDPPAKVGVGDAGRPGQDACDRRHRLPE